jgi:hypothetical protein
MTSEWVGHEGGEEGVATEAFYRPADGFGVVLLSNAEWSVSRVELLEIEAALISFGATL